MTKLFLAIYRFFLNHKTVFYAILTVSSAVFIYFGLKIRFQENFVDILPKTEKSRDCGVAFGSIKVKDKVFMEVISSSGSKDTGQIASAMDSLMNIINANDRNALVADAFCGIDTDDIMNLAYYGMEALPCHLPEEAYGLFDSLLDKDPEEVLSSFSTSQIPGGLTLIDSHIFSTDSTTAVCFINPGYDSYDTLKGGRFEKMLRKSVHEFEIRNPGFKAFYHGIPIDSAWNSRRTKMDIIFTIGISLLLICLLICVCFKSRNSLPFLLSPVVYGTFFALACIYWIKGEMSFIAIGIGALVLGVAISYSLHVVIHHKFVADVEQLLSEQVKPVCMGCLTTIGAFCALLFTSSTLLQDFGLFSTLALIGTTFFSLAFLPQFFTDKVDEKNEKAFSIVNRINSYPIDHKKPLVVAVALICIVSLFTARYVKFDKDLNHIGYKSPQAAESERLYNDKVNGQCTSAYFAAYADDLESAIAFNKALPPVLDSLKQSGLISSFSSVDGIIIPEKEQQDNIDRWKTYWTPQKVEKACGALRDACGKYGWNVPDFDIPETFRLMTESDFYPTSLYDAGVIPEGLLCNFVEHNEDGWLVFTNVLMDPAYREEVTGVLTHLDHIIVLDPFYYTGDMVEIAHDDFNTVLMISSIFVFLVLLLSFRSLMAALTAFMPMSLSWFVVQSAMALAGLQFNLINILISSFIFGVGVDYSIFVMEGLMGRARSGSQRLLLCHKAAIFFSAVILLTVTASLLFALHPAIYSVGICTIIGMASTIIITYILQPVVFKFISRSSVLKREMLRQR